MKQFIKLKNLKTLLIDDNPVIRDTMKMIFAQKDCPLKTFETAEEGLQALEEERFDILISDFQLPGIDGVEFFKQAMVSQPDTIKILISGYGNERAVSEAFDIGVHAFIRKPFTLTAFLDQLMPYVEQRLSLASQRRSPAVDEEDPEKENQPATNGKKIKGARLTRAKHDLRPLSNLPPDFNKDGTFSEGKSYPDLVAV